MNQLWTAFVVYYYLPQIIGTALILFAVYLLTRLVLAVVFKVRTPRWWRGNRIIPLMVAVSCLIIVAAGYVVSKVGIYAWDHQYTNAQRQEAKSLDFKVYVPSYVPISNQIFQQAISKSENGTKSIFTTYGINNGGQDIAIREFSAAKNPGDNCNPTEPDAVSRSSKCIPYATTAAGVQLFQGDYGDVFATIGGTRIVVENLPDTDRGTDYKTSSVVKNEALKLFESFHQVDPTTLEYVNRSNLHATN